MLEANITGKETLISVVMPVFNGETYIVEAVESVLSQSTFRFDLIIVDDGSTDHTASIACKFGPLIRYCYQMHSGISAARNKGVQMAQGDFLAFLDADDLWTKNKTNLQWKAFEKEPELDMVFGNVRQFISPDLSEDEKANINIPVETLAGQVPGSMLIRKKSFLRVGLFKEELKLGEFIDWYARAVELNLKSIMLPDIVLERRIHKTNTGILQRNQRSGYVHALKAALDRRRSGK